MEVGEGLPTIKLLSEAVLAVAVAVVALPVLVEQPCFPILATMVATAAGGQVLMVPVEAEEPTQLEALVVVRRVETVALERLLP